MLRGIKPGTAFILKHGCPEFLLPVLDSYLVGLDKFLGSAYRSELPEWKPLFLKEICYNNRTDWNKIAQQLPHVSVVDSGKVAYWQTGAKMASGRETRTTVGRYVGRQLELEVDSEKLVEEFRRMACNIGVNWLNLLEFICSIMLICRIVPKRCTRVTLQVIILQVSLSTRVRRCKELSRELLLS